MSRRGDRRRSRPGTPCPEDAGVRRDGVDARGHRARAGLRRAFNVGKGRQEARRPGEPERDRIAFTGAVTKGSSAPLRGRNRKPLSPSSAASRRCRVRGCRMDALVKQAVGQSDNAGKVCLACTSDVQREIYDESSTVRRGPVGIRRRPTRRRTT